MNKIENVVIGADPEMFLIDKEKNKHISAIGLIPGNKYEPYPISKEGHGVLTDNVAVEFVFPPTNNKEEFYNHIKKCQDWFLNNIPKELSLSDKVSVEFDNDQLDNMEAQTFGCSTSYNVYTGKPNPSPKAKKANLRSVGGHIHTGWDNPTNDQREAVVKAVELFVTLPMVLFEPENERRKLYGKSGEFRPKSYGIEARSPSAYWVTSKELIDWTFDSVMNAINWLNEGNVMDLGTELSMIKAINTYDKGLAESILNELKIPVKQTLLINN